MRNPVSILPLEIVKYKIGNDRASMKKSYINRKLIELWNGIIGGEIITRSVTPESCEKFGTTVFAISMDGSYSKLLIEKIIEENMGII